MMNTTAKPWSTPKMGLRENVQPFKYLKLTNPDRDIRIATIMPGNFNDPLRIEIFHTLLHNVIRPSPNNQPTKQELRNTLPDAWSIHETVQGKFIFSTTNDCGNLVTSWKHPDPEVDASLYEAPPGEELWGCETVFEALSYVWGPQHGPEPVLIIPSHCPWSMEYGRLNGPGRLLIGQNLAALLRHIRYTDKPRKIWADALCINQQDIAERERQVLLMKDIYRLASRVVVWLGQEYSNSDVAVTSLSRLGAQLSALNKSSQDKPEVWLVLT